MRFEHTFLCCTEEKVISLSSDEKKLSGRKISLKTHCLVKKKMQYEIRNYIVLGKFVIIAMKK